MPATLADVPTLPTVDIPGVELCRPGRWNTFDYTPADLARAAVNWRALKGTWDVPLTLGHDGESALGDGAPALGWVDNVRFEDDTLIGDYVKVPANVAALIKAGALAKRSCTFLMDAEIDGVQRDIVLRNVALLGARAPAVDGLADVAALYNARRLRATGGTTRTLVYGSIAELPANVKKLPEGQQRQWLAVWNSAYKAAKDKGMTAKNAEAAAFRQANAVALARLPIAYQERRQLATGPSYDGIRSAVQAALNAAYSPSQPIGDAEPTPGETPTPSSTIIALYSDAVVVEDNDGDAAFEIPQTTTGGVTTLGSPQMVELRPIPIAGEPTEASEEPGTPPGPVQREGEPTPTPEQEPEPIGAAPSAQMARLAATVADSAVEELIAKAKADFDALLAGVDGIAAGKPGVTEFRSLVQSAVKALDRIKVAKAAAGGGAPAALQNSREEDDDMTLISDLARLHGLPETASREEVLRAVEGAAVSKGVVTTLARKVDELLERDATKEIDRKLEAAIAEGRLKRWNKPGEDGTLYTTLRTLARSDMKTAETMLAALPPLVDRSEYGLMGDPSAPPSQTLPPKVAADLRALGRDPEQLSTESLDERWRRDRQERETARALKAGLPKPVFAPERRR